MGKRLTKKTIMKTLKFILKTDQAFLFFMLSTTIAVGLLLALFNKPVQAYLVDGVWRGVLFIAGLVLNVVFLLEIWNAAKIVRSENDVTKLLEKQGFISDGELTPVEPSEKASFTPENK